jgi:uncharacterized membrane protein
MPFTPIILVHVAAAIGALVTGALMLWLKKGTPQHRLFGRIWVTLMLATALVSFGIKSSGHFSAIHLLSVLTLLALGISILAVIKGRIRAHRHGMISLYISLLIAGAFTLLPDRRLGYLVWHAAGWV